MIFNEIFTEICISFRDFKKHIEYMFIVNHVNKDDHRDFTSFVVCLKKLNDCNDYMMYTDLRRAMSKLLASGTYSVLPFITSFVVFCGIDPLRTSKTLEVNNTIYTLKN